MTRIIALLILPFLLNDFFLNYFQSDFSKFISALYITSVLALGIIVFELRKKTIKSEDLGTVPISVKSFLIWSVLLSIYGVIADQTVGPSLYPYFKEWALFKFPVYPNESIRWFDLTVGIALGAVSEELVFRGTLLSFLRKRLPAFGSISLSILAFGLIHWGVGPNSVINAVAWAILPTIYVFKYRSVYPVIVAHFITNFVGFY